MTDEVGLYYHLSLLRVAGQKAVSRYAKRLGPGALRLGPLKPPVGSHWVAIRPVLSGICGSDLGLIWGKSSPYLAPLSSFPAVLGHEIVGQVVSPGVAVPEGTLVVVNPSLACQARTGPPCETCAHGRSDYCERRISTDFPSGMLLGYSRDVSGGWASLVWAPSSQIYPVPTRVRPEQAVLAEPLAIIYNALDKLDWSDIGSVLIVGAGTIGLLTLFLIRTLYSLRVWVHARYPHQADLVESMGGLLTDRPTTPGSTEEDMDTLRGTRSRSLWGSRPWQTKGFDLVVDTIGSAHSVAQSLTETRPGGQILLIGGAGAMRVDLAPLWARGIRWIGSYGYGTDARQTFARVLSILEQSALPVPPLVTHVVPLLKWREAFDILADRRSGAIKVAFTPVQERTR